MAFIPPPVWDVIGAYALSAVEGVEAVKESDDVAVLKWVVRVLKPDLSGALDDACYRGRPMALAIVDEMPPAERRARADTALHLACQGDHTQLVFDLVGRMGVTRCDIVSFRLFRYACAHGRPAVALRLISELKLTRSEIMADNNYAFTAACQGGHSEIVARLIDETKMSRAEVMEDGNFAFTAACRSGHAGTAALLADRYSMTLEEARLDSWLPGACRYHPSVAAWAVGRFSVPGYLLASALYAAACAGNATLLATLRRHSAAAQ